MSTRKTLGWSMGLALVGVSLVPTVVTRAEIIDLAAYLTGDCAGSGEPEKGWGTLTLDPATGQLDYSIDYDPSLQSQFAHIHAFPDGCGNVPSGQIIVILPAIDNPMIGQTTLTAQDVDDMLAGATYVNIHTPQFSSGEIAGEIWPVPTPRYLSFFPSILTSGSAAATQAIRVKLVSLHHPDPPTSGSPDFTAFEGEFRWVGVPSTLNENGGANATFDAAQLQCTVEFRDWSSVPSLLHVFGNDVVPSSVYEFQFADDTCPDLSDPSCYSDPVEVWTVAWGDVVEPYGVRTGSGQPNFSDISAVVDKFRTLANAKIMARVDLVTPGSPGVPNSPNQEVEFGDISACVDAFRGFAYPFTMGPSCPE